MTAPVLVTPAPARSLPASSPTSFEMPKSRILRMVDPSSRWWMKRFSGLRSRWTMPLSRAPCRATRAACVRCSTTSPPSRRPARGEDPLQIEPVEQLHDQERRARELGRDVRVDHLDDVLTADARRRLRLALEALDRQRVARREAVEELQREQVPGAQVLDDVDDAHAAPAELADDAVARGDERGRGGVHDASGPLRRRG